MYIPVFATYFFSQIQPHLNRLVAQFFHPPIKSSMASQWTTAQCVEFLRKCAKWYAEKIPEQELERYICTFQDNFITGSSLASIQDTNWISLILAIAMRDFVHKELAVVNRISDQEARTAKLYSRKDRQPQLKLVLKHMPSKLQTTSFSPKRWLML